jgi:iron complex outermembrane recepter protein
MLHCGRALLTNQLYVLYVFSYIVPRDGDSSPQRSWLNSPGWIVTHKNGRSLATGIALTALCAPAFSQITPATNAASASSTDITEIVVTANKREERLQEVPIAVTVVGGAQLTQQNINDVVDLTRNVPSLNVAGPFGALSIRGIGSESFSRSAEGSVGVVVDGVALANTSTNPPQLFDVARVEVLEGPQGMLFGRNSSAGIINLVTNAPDPDHFEVDTHADIGTLDTYIARAVINIPVAYRAALRISGTYSQSPNTQFNRFDGTDYNVDGQSVRARFQWEPSSALTVNLIGDYSDVIQRGGVPWSVYYSTPGSLLSSRLAGCGVTVNQANTDGCIDGGNHTTNESYGFSAQVDARVGDVTLTSISAFRGFTARSYESDVDSVPVNVLNEDASPENIHNLSQEFRITSPSGGLIDYVAGLYYFHSYLNGTNTEAGDLFAALGEPFLIGQALATTSTTRSAAAFGQATVNLTPAFHLILGGRYGNENVNAVTIGSLAPGAVAPFANIAGVRGAADDRYFSYRGGLQYNISREVMAYATYTRGYKGPAINDQSGGGGIPVLVQPEIPHAGEIGLKSTLLDGRLAANIAVFYNRVTDFQTQYFDPTIAQFVFGNAPSLTSKGVSFELLGKPLQGLTVNFGGLYNNARYGSGYEVACSQLQSAAQGCQTVIEGGVPVSTTDAHGNPLIGAPEWKVTSSVEYSANVRDGLSGVVSVDAVYTSRINFDAAYDPIDTNAAATVFGGRLAVRRDDGRYGVSLFVRNMFNQYRPIVRFATPTAAEQFDPQSYSQIAGPESHRVVGISLDGKF